MKKFSPILQDLIEAFKQLPGIGVKSAQRIVFYLLQSNTDKALFLAETIQKSLVSIQECKICRMYSEEELCEICKDTKRDQSLLCIVESPADLIALENTMQFNGRYFVLMGHFSPLDGIGPDELKSISWKNYLISIPSMKLFWPPAQPWMEKQLLLTLLLSL